MNKVSEQLRCFKLFGLQRTATNLMMRGLLANFDVQSGENGWEWKHGPITRAAEDGLAIVVCVRHPLAWLDAMYRFSMRTRDRDGCKHFRRTWTFAEFCVNRHYRWQNPVLRWNEMNRHYSDWVANHPTQGLLVRSEELLGTKLQEEVFMRVGGFFQWNRKDDTIHTFRRKVRHATPTLGSLMDWDYYLLRKYIALYTQELLALVTGQIDKELAERLSYAL